MARQLYVRSKDADHQVMSDIKGMPPMNIHGGIPPLKQYDM